MRRFNSSAAVAELTGLSRQGVRDAIKKGEEELRGYESRLHLTESSAERAGSENRILLDEAVSELNRILPLVTEDEARRVLTEVLGRLESVRGNDSPKE